MGSIKNEFVYFSQQAGSVEGATEVVTNAEDGSFRSNSEIEGENLVREPALQSSMLVTVSECSKGDVGDETVEGCSMVATGLGHGVGQGKHSDSCGSPFDLVDKNGSPMRNSGNLALGLDDVAGCSMVVYSHFVDRKGSCYTADDYAAPSSESLQTSQVNKCNETQQNGQ